MRKAIYISGILSVNLLLFGSLFKILHLPGAGLMLLCSFLLLVFGFLPSALINNYKHSDKSQSPWLHIIVYLVCLLDFIGALFKIMHWPGASIFLIFGIPAPFVLFLPAYIYHHNKQKSKTDFNFFAIMFLFVYVAVFSVLLAVKPSKTVVENGVILNEQNRNTYNALEQVNSLKNKELMKLGTEADKICKYISKIQFELLSISGNQPMGYEESDLTFIKNKMDKQVSARYFDEQNNKLNELKKSIEQYRELALKNIPPKNKHQLEFVLEILDTSQLVYRQQETIKGAINLRHSTLMAVLNQLSRLQTNVRLVEQEVTMVKSAV